MVPPERAFEGTVQDGCADVKEWLHCPSVPTHLLPFDYSAGGE
jgi:hypothetical protein